MKECQFLGGPRDGEWVAVSGSGIVVVEPSASLTAWFADENPCVSLPVFTEVRYEVVKNANGRWYAVHPDVYRALLR